jgi:RIO kinase 1
LLRSSRVPAPQAIRAPRDRPRRPHCIQALVALARDGLAHGDLSAYNLLVHDGRLVLIDLPQVVDVIANPRGAWFLNRDAENIGRWFAGHGLSGVRPEPADLPALLRREALLSP